MTNETVTLDFVAAQQRQSITDLGALRDDLRVLTAIAMRQDNTLAAMLEQLRVMVAQHQRTADRVRALEGMD
jgi:hypothetical protein